MFLFLSFRPRAAASRAKRNVPTLSGPPSDKKGGGQRDRSPKKASAAVEAPDLLSGFELAGASNSHVRSRSNSSTKSHNAKNAARDVGGGQGAGAGDPASNIFEGFAAPPVVYPAPGASEWVMVGPGSEGEGLAPGIYGENEGCRGGDGGSVGRSVGGSVFYRLKFWSVGYWVKYVRGLIVCRPVSRSVYRSNGLSIERSVGQSVSRSVVFCPVGLSVRR